MPSGPQSATGLSFWSETVPAASKIEFLAFLDVDPGVRPGRPRGDGDLLDEIEPGRAAFLDGAGERGRRDGKPSGGPNDRRGASSFAQDVEHRLVDEAVAGQTSG